MLQQRAEGVEYGGPSELMHKDTGGCDTRNRSLNRMMNGLKTFWECVLDLNTESRVAKALCSRLSPKKGVGACPAPSYSVTAQYRGFKFMGVPKFIHKDCLP